MGARELGVKLAWLVWRCVRECRRVKEDRLSASVAFSRDGFPYAYVGAFAAWKLEGVELLW